MQSKLVGTLFLESQCDAFFSQAPSLPHVVFAGRSNVGKSSLINALLQRKALARVSSTPGKTRSINVYTLERNPFFLVDLPGYGFAKCGKTERSSWSSLIGYYLESRKAHDDTYIVLLLDARRAPQENDVRLVEYIYALRLPLIPVFTKIDKTTQKERAKNNSAWKKYCMATFFQTSSHTGFGIQKLWDHIFECVGDSYIP